MMGLEGVLLLLIVLFLVSCDVVVGGSRVSAEDLEFERQAKLLNKPSVKSIQIKDGNIFDCVEIHKQPAFDHPLLKNHTIQMRPSAFPKGILDQTSSAPKSIISGVEERGGCPLGTVPIRRVGKEDLKRAQILSKSYAKRTLASEPAGYHFATARVTSDGSKKYYGAHAHINIQNPSVPPKQFSEAMIWTENGPADKRNAIQVGWTVNPGLYGNNHTRLTSIWTADGYQKTGCFDLLCPGFVYVQSNISFGDIFRTISQYHGDQFEMKYQVFQDPKTGNWWLSFSYKNIAIGYWPKSLFTNLASFASTIVFGGEVYSPPKTVSPPMGSGHFPKDRNIREASFYRMVMVVDESFKLVDPDASLIELTTDRPTCYGVEDHFYHDDYWRYHFLFGGPGGHCNFYLK